MRTAIAPRPSEENDFFVAKNRFAMRHANIRAALSLRHIDAERQAELHRTFTTSSRVTQHAKTALLHAVTDAFQSFDPTLKVAGAFASWLAFVNEHRRQRSPLETIDETARLVSAGEIALEDYFPAE